MLLKVLSLSHFALAALFVVGSPLGIPLTPEVSPVSNPKAVIQHRSENPLRRVTAIVDVWVNKRAVSPSGEVLHQIHSAIEIAGNDDDGPLRVEIIVDNSKLGQGFLAIRALDFSTALTGRAIKITDARDTERYLQLLGDTRLTNSEIADRETGKGLVADAWAIDNVYRTGPDNLPVNSCNTLIQRLILGLDLPLQGILRDLFRKDEEYTQLHAQSHSLPINHLLIDTLVDPDDRGGPWRIVYDIEDPKAPVREHDNEPWRRMAHRPPQDPSAARVPSPNPFASGPPSWTFEGDAQEQ